MKKTTHIPVIPIGEQRPIKSSGVSPAEAFIRAEVERIESASNQVQLPQPDVQVKDIRNPADWLPQPSDASGIPATQQPEVRATAIPGEVTVESEVIQDADRSKREKRHTSKFGRDPVTGYALTKDGQVRKPRKDIGIKQGKRGIQDEDQKV